jgi:hypothetical protein
MPASFPRVRSEETGIGAARPRVARAWCGSTATRQRCEPEAPGVAWRGCGSGTEPGLDRSQPRGRRRPAWCWSFLPFHLLPSSIHSLAVRFDTCRLSAHAPVSIVEKGHFVGSLGREVGPIDFAALVQCAQMFHRRGDAFLDRVGWNGWRKGWPVPRQGHRRLRGYRGHLLSIPARHDPSEPARPASTWRGLHLSCSTP